MKSVIILIAMIVGLASNATAGDLQILTRDVNGETLIFCAIPAEMGKIEKAYIKFYSDNEKILQGRNSEMELIGGSNAVYTVPGTHQILEGKVEILVSNLDNKIIRKDFVFNN